MARVDGHSTKVWIYPRRKAGESGATPARGRNPVQLTRSAVAALFPTPQADAAQVLGISITALKAVCRKLGISRWPYMRGNKALASPFKFELVRNDWPVPQTSEESKPIFACTTASRRRASLSRVASSAITVPRTASAGPGPSQACDLGDDSMHAIGGDAFVSSSGAGDGNTIEAGFKLSDGNNIEADCELGDDLGWMLWNDAECLDSAEARWWERVRSAHAECATGAQAYQGLGGNMVFFTEVRR
jgi:hypothetical protein